LKKARHQTSGNEHRKTSMQREKKHENGGLKTEEKGKQQWQGYEERGTRGGGRGRCRQNFRKNRGWRFKMELVRFAKDPRHSGEARHGSVVFQTLGRWHE